MKNKKIQSYLLLVLIQFTLQLLYNTAGPLYNYSGFTDVHIFMNIADAMVHGKVIYKDIVDWKGVLLFQIYEWIEIVLGGRKTFFPAFIVTEISAIGCTVMFFKASNCGKEKNDWLTTVLFILCYNVNLICINGGGCPEEYICFFVLYMMYSSRKGYFRECINEERKKQTVSLLICGAGIGITSMTKISWGIVFFLFYGVMTVCALYHREFKCIFKIFVCTLAGMLIPVSVSFAYLLKNNAVNEFVKVYFRDNFIYVREVYDITGAICGKFGLFVLVAEAFWLFMVVYSVLHLVHCLRCKKNKKFIEDFALFICLCGGYILVVLCSTHKGNNYYVPLYSILLLLNKEKLCSIINKMFVYLWSLVFCFSGVFAWYFNIDYYHFNVKAANDLKEIISSSSACVPLTISGADLIWHAEEYPKYFFAPLRVHIQNEDYWNTWFDMIENQKTDFCLVLPESVENGDELKYSYVYSMYENDKTNADKLSEMLMQNYTPIKKVGSGFLLCSNSKCEEENYRSILFTTDEE